MSDTPVELNLEDAAKTVKQLMRERDTKILADMQWMSSNMQPTGSEAEALVKERDSKIAHRNQVLYCVGILAKDEFKYTDIEALIRRRFPRTNQGAVLNVAHAMSELANDKTGILKRTPKGDGYMLKDPVFRAAIGNMLRCADDSEAVEKVVSGGN